MEEVNKSIELQDVINHLGIKRMWCRSGNGLMSYGYSFIQIGGYKGESGDDVGREEMWDGDYTKPEVVLDCRNLECKPISKEALKLICQSHIKEMATKINKEQLYLPTEDFFLKHTYKSKKLIRSSISEQLANKDLSKGELLYILEMVTNLGKNL